MELRPMSMSRTMRAVTTFSVVFVLYICGIFVREQFGILVRIRNGSNGTVRLVSVKMENRGHRYLLRDLGAGDRIRAFAKPVGKSHINLEYTDARNVQRNEILVGYAESGSCGTVNATIREEGRIDV